jgi:hypothetical protein
MLIIEAISEFFLIKKNSKIKNIYICTFLTQKKRRKNFLKSHYKIKEKIFPKIIWKIVLVRWLHLTLTQSRECYREQD